MMEHLMEQHQNTFGACSSSRTTPAWVFSTGYSPSGMDCSSMGLLWGHGSYQERASAQALMGHMKVWFLSLNRVWKAMFAAPCPGISAGWDAEFCCIPLPCWTPLFFLSSSSIVCLEPKLPEGSPFITFVEEDSVLCGLISSFMYLGLQEELVNG